MNYWVQPSKQEIARSQRATDIPDTASVARMIPPERVGVDGGYDHSGLANRVMLTLRDQFEAIEIGQLSVLQRGRVIIFLGQVSDWRLLARLVNIASAVYGTSAVETNGLTVLDEVKVSQAISYSRQ